MNIVFRVDSSNLIGSGHLMRCLTLATQQRKLGNDIVFICRDLDGNLSDLVNEKGFKVELLPKVKHNDNLDGYAQWLTVTQEQDAFETINILKRYKHIDRAVVDSYAIDETWEKMIRPYTDEIFVIDDLANRKHDCDVLLDQNYYFDKEIRYNGLVPADCKLLLGPRYALLRQEFYYARQGMNPRSSYLHNILVFYGGVDATDETSKAIAALDSLKENGELDDVSVTVVVGDSNSRKETIADSCCKAGFKYLCQVSNMAQLMAEADLMLGAGGTTTWERCYLGLPAIVTAVAENQYQICEDCSTVGLFYYLGHWDVVTRDNIYEAVIIMKNPNTLLNMQKAIGRIFA